MPTSSFFYLVLANVLLQNEVSLGLQRRKELGAQLEELLFPLLYVTMEATSGSSPYIRRGNWRT